MMRANGTLIKFAVFATVMAFLTAFLFMAFGQTQWLHQRLLGGVRRRLPPGEIGRAHV